VVPRAAQYAWRRMDRYVLVARLKPEGRERAQELLAEYPLREGLSAAFDRQAIFLSESEVVFFFEGPDADRSVTAILNDPSLTEIGHWIPLFDGPLHRAPEAYFWERAGD
jgi:hypothetical protein